MTEKGSEDCSQEVRRDRENGVSDTNSGQKAFTVYLHAESDPHWRIAVCLSLCPCPAETPCRALLMFPQYLPLKPEYFGTSQHCDMNEVQLRCAAPTEKQPVDLPSEVLQEQGKFEVQML